MIQGQIRLIVKNMLSNYEVLTAGDGLEALTEMDRNQDIDLMILDLDMPNMNGFELLELMQKNPDYSSIRTIILTNFDEIEHEVKGLSLGAVDFIRKPLNIELVATRDITIHALVGLLEVRNIESSNHTIRTQKIMQVLCDYLKSKKKYKSILTENYIKDIVSTTPLHDIGKVGIPDNILLKPGKLNSEEFNIMKKHVEYGIIALKDEIHGEDIPFEGRLMGIIDVYDALMNKRVYKPAFEFNETITIMEKEKGKHFDPEILDAFFEIKDKVYEISKKYSQEHNLLGEL